MNDQKLFTIIRASEFLPKYAGIEFTAMTKHKLRKLDGHNKPCDFTVQERKKINRGLVKLIKDLERTVDPWKPVNP
jgi:hypothetical protein